MILYFKYVSISQGSPEKQNQQRETETKRGERFNRIVLYDHKLASLKSVRQVGRVEIQVRVAVAVLCLRS